MKISNGTIARTIILVLALINQILAITGRGTIDIADDTVYQLCSLGATVITSAIAWWKNNSFTQNALQADEVLTLMKEEDTKEGEEDEI